MFNHSKSYKIASTKYELRKFFLQNNEIPTQTEMIQNLSQPLATVIQSTLPSFPKYLLHIDDDNDCLDDYGKTVQKSFKIDKSVTKSCNHETILKLGETILKRITKRNEVIFKNALNRKEDMMKQEFCNELCDSIEQDQLFYDKLEDKYYKDQIITLDVKKNRIVQTFEKNLLCYKEIISGLMLNKLANIVKEIQNDKQEKLCECDSRETDNTNLSGSVPSYTEDAIKTSISHEIMIDNDTIASIINIISTIFTIKHKSKSYLQLNLNSFREELKNVLQNPLLRRGIIKINRKPLQKLSKHEFHTFAMEIISKTMEIVCESGDESVILNKFQLENELVGRCSIMIEQRSSESNELLPFRI